MKSAPEDKAVLATSLLEFKENVKERVTFLTSRRIYPRHVGHTVKQNATEPPPADSDDRVNSIVAWIR